MIHINKIKPPIKLEEYKKTPNSSFDSVNKKCLEVLYI